VTTPTDRRKPKAAAPKAKGRAATGKATTDRREAAKALVEGISASEQFTLTSNYLHFVGEKSKK
jgi:hypothetical protein